MIFERWSLFDGERYALADVIRLAGEVSGRSEREFFERYVDGTDFLDIAPTFDADSTRDGGFDLWQVRGV